MSDPLRDARLDIAHVNEISGGVETTAHLVEFDSLQGRWRANISTPDADDASVDRRLRASASPRPPTLARLLGAIWDATSSSSAPASSEAGNPSGVF